MSLLGWTTLLLGAFGAAGNLLQALAAALVPADPATTLAAFGLPVPPLLDWLLAHALALALLGALLSLLLAVLGIGLLRRRQWARRGMVAALVLGAMANFAALALVDPLFSGLGDLSPAGAGPELAELQARLDTARHAVLVLVLAGALAIAALHGWLVWKLCTPTVRAEFRG